MPKSLNFTLRQAIQCSLVLVSTLTLSTNSWAQQKTHAIKTAYPIDGAMINISGVSLSKSLSENIEYVESIGYKCNDDEKNINYIFCRDENTFDYYVDFRKDSIRIGCGTFGMCKGPEDVARQFLREEPIPKFYDIGYLMGISQNFKETVVIFWKHGATRIHLQPFSPKILFFISDSWTVLLSRKMGEVDEFGDADRYEYSYGCEYEVKAVNLFPHEVYISEVKLTVRGMKSQDIDFDSVIQPRGTAVSKHFKNTTESYSTGIYGSQIFDKRINDRQKRELKEKYGCETQKTKLSFSVNKKQIKFPRESSFTLSGDVNRFIKAKDPLKLK